VIPGSAFNRPAPHSTELVDRTLAAAYASGTVRGDGGHEHAVYPTSVDQAQGEAIRALVVAERAARTLEVGFALGLSSLHICAGLLEVGQADARHVTVDPTETWFWHNAGRRLVEAAGLSDTVEIVEESSHVALPRWTTERRQFDIAFIDGDHRFDPCFLDIWYALLLVKSGGLVVVDDMWMPSVRMAVAFFQSNVDLELLSDAMPGAFRWNRRLPWRKVRPGVGTTAVLRKPQIHVERDSDHFVPFW
jgi:predicted O-methyltransferase YrrM